MFNYNSVSEFSQNFDGLILDIWGVIHDGVKPYPGAVDCLRELQLAGKEVVFVSNAPRRADAVAAKFRQMDISPLLYRDIVSSGDVARQMLLNKYPEPTEFLYTGSSRDAVLMEGTSHSITTDPNRAKYYLNSGFNHQTAVWTEPEIFDKALLRSLPMVCINPDRAVTLQTGGTNLCAGTIATKYLERRGKVSFVGKPYPEIYKVALTKFSSAIKKDRILAVGDGFETDIMGANRAGIPSVICMSGMLRGDYNLLANLVSEYGIAPGGTIPGFAFARQPVKGSLAA